MFFIRTLMIIKNASNSPSLVSAMCIYKIIVAGFFELPVKIRVKPVADIFIGIVKMSGIFFKQIIRCQISTATKPSINYLIILIIQFEHAIIAVNCWYKGICRMDDD